MTASSLSFKHLEIRRTPGFRNGGFTLASISTGINLVFGPNGAGKTTTAEALKMLLWPELAREARAAVAGRFELNGTGWLIEIDADRAQYQRDGMESAPPSLPASDLHDRYSLSLHALISADDSHFASRIIQEMAGGYDLQAARVVLKERATPPGHPNEVAAVKAARGQLTEAIVRQEELREQERRLEDLVEERHHAQYAARRIGAVQGAIALARAAEAENDAREVLGKYPDAMSRLKGDEHESVTRARAGQDDIRASLSAIEKGITDAEERVARAALPDGGLPRTLIQTLRSRCNELNEAQRRVAEQEKALAEAMRRRDGERQTLGQAADDETLDQLDFPAVGALSEFARTAGEVRAAREASRAELRRLLDDNEVGDPEKLAEGCRILRSWLRIPDADASESKRLRRLGAIGSGCLIAGVGLIALYAIEPAFALGGAIIAVVGGMLLYTVRTAGSSSATRRSIHQEDYLALTLDPPSRWSTSEVELHLERLSQQQRGAAKNASNAARRAEIRAEEANLTAREEAVERERLDLARRYGVDAGASPEQLYWLIERLNRWQDAHRGVQAAQAALGIVQSQATALREDLSARLAEFGYGGGDPAIAVDDLEQRDRAYREAVADLGAHTRNLSDRRERLSELDDHCHRIAERLGITTDDEAVISDWCARYEQYKADSELLVKAQEAVRIERARLRDIGATDDLRNRPIADLEIELSELTAKAGNLDDLNRSITSIETLIRRAKDSHDMEAALANVDAAEAALADLREPALRGLIGHDLLGYVETATRDHNLPAVFHRAREIFTSVTHGRYRLQFAASPDASFRALDTRTERGHALDELSSGTRVQLLIAVRLAFVEAQEMGIKLPLFLDEALGNSDDARALALIEAVLQLARDGRQIFYFTAQSDEIGKWQQLLRDNPELPSRVIDLVEIRKLEQRSDSPKFDVGQYPIARVPSPNGDGHGEYGKKLEVPAISPSAPLGGLHLWYLVEEPAELYGLLKLGLTCWGELRAYIEHGGARLIDPDKFAGWEAAARAAEEALSLSLVGRGRPVDRLAIAQSGAVSDVFMDRVDDLCASLGGDGRLLLEALENREIKGFRSSSTDALREYLDAHGYIDLRDSLKEDEILLRARASAASDVATGVITQPAVDRLLVRLLTR
ncbi:MAG TPA: AAA family ATPase [Longimicrobiaceae bacterium]|nr:AAA family ATPase [Longimicrobiaceae bacterium]